jgi:glycosyltransferase XagB
MQDLNSKPLQKVQASPRQSWKASCHDAKLYLPILLALASIGFGIVWVQNYRWLLSFLYGLVVLSWIPILVGAVQLGFKHWTQPTQPPVLSSPTETLPRITILLPVYKEANMLAQLSDMLSDLDYPADKLQCLLLIEADDRTTALAAVQMTWPSFFQIMSLPEGTPKTKPRACNFALARASGDLLVIFDAEDKPHPQQLREAAARFKGSDANLACVQAPLEIDAHSGNWMQRQFALEYRMLFRIILPCLSRASRALPLGGTSNYFRTRMLRELDGWDAYNLTEDADLGVKLARANLQTQTLTLPTIENAPDRLSIWYHQRTRWLSGHIQTLFVHAPPPRANVATIWRWFMCMLVIVGRLASEPTHGLTLLLVSQQMTQTDLGTGFELRGLVPFTGHFVMFLVLVQLAPSARFSHRIWLGLSHNVYWLMTLFPLLNATKRMALGQLSWLKSAHKPYEPQLKLGSKSSQPVEPRQGPIKIQLAKPDLSAPH